MDVHGRHALASCLGGLDHFSFADLKREVEIVVTWSPHE